MTDAGGSPELPWSTVEHYLGARQAAGYRLSAPISERTVWYEIGDGGQEISLQVELDRHQQPPRSSLPAVAIDQVWRDGTRMARIRTTHVGLMRDFHDLLIAVADRVVTGERDLAQAFEETVHAWGRLLDRPRGLGVERRIGLHGELAVLYAVARSHGWARAVDSWTGPKGEQHDFGLPGADLEVKTTASEVRRHTVHGVHQLTETPGRPLWFASLQLTRGGLGGCSLRESVAEVIRDARAADRIASVRLEDALAAGGWSEGDPDDERWTLRTAPLLVPADQLPRLTESMIPLSVREHVSSIDYRMDVTHLSSVPGSPVDLTEFRLPCPTRTPN
ncbi:PD-(D/E)XK motif protein [Streptomyces sp. NBC_01351]|uniref:PD-(D/E)XK motif protein n=1 Tax=Streptomyces sp. NBC_01351 TaxID=2903833 RepID=UPI002E2FB0DA|nr:PD-(D/E)XK motif protein [Streptomyces sp. NBC_01351]